MQTFSQPVSQPTKKPSYYGWGSPSPAAPAAPSAPSPSAVGGTAPKPPNPGLVPSKAGGWVDTNHPDAAPSTLGSGSPANPVTWQPPIPLPITPPTINVPPVAAYQAGTLPHMNVPGYNAPQQQEAENAQIAALLRAISSPLFSDANVAGMKEKQKETALKMGSQASAAAAQDAASRGVSAGGQLGATNRRIGDTVRSDILDAYRDIDLDVPERNLSAMLASSSALGSALSGQADRAGSAYQLGLLAPTFANQAALSQEGLRQAQAGSELATAGLGAQIGSENARLALQAALANNDLFFQGRDADRADSALALQGELGRGGLGLDSRRLDETGRQFNLSHALAIQHFLEGQRQFDGTMGFNYANANLTAAQRQWLAGLGLI